MELAANWYVMLLLVRSLATMLRQLLGTAAGLTHASSVIDVVRSSDAASATVTRSLVPSKRKAPP